MSCVCVSEWGSASECECVCVCECASERLCERVSSKLLCYHIKSREQTTTTTTTTTTTRQIDIHMRTSRPLERRVAQAGHSPQVSPAADGEAGRREGCRCGPRHTPLRTHAGGRAQAGLTRRVRERDTRRVFSVCSCDKRTPTLKMYTLTLTHPQCDGSQQLLLRHSLGVARGGRSRSLEGAAPMPPSALPPPAARSHKMSSARGPNESGELGFPSSSGEGRAPAAALFWPLLAPGSRPRRSRGACARQATTRRGRVATREGRRGSCSAGAVACARGARPIDQRSGRRTGRKCNCDREPFGPDTSALSRNRADETA